MFLSGDSRQQCGCTQGASSGRRRKLCFSKSSWATFRGKSFWSAEQILTEWWNTQGVGAFSRSRRESCERQRRHHKQVDENASLWMLRGDCEDFLTVQEATENCGLRKRPERKDTLLNREGRNGLKALDFRCPQVSSFKKMNVLACLLMKSCFCWQHLC